jgi:hypothetical protein
MWKEIMSRVLNKLNALHITISTGILGVLKSCNSHLESIKKSLEVNYGTQGQQCPENCRVFLEGRLSSLLSQLAAVLILAAIFFFFFFGLMEVLAKENMGRLNK